MTLLPVADKSYLFLITPTNTGCFQPFWYITFLLCQISHFHLNLHFFDNKWWWSPFHMPTGHLYVLFREVSLAFLSLLLDWFWYLCQRDFLDLVIPPYPRLWQWSLSLLSRKSVRWSPLSLPFPGPLEFSCCIWPKEKMEVWLVDLLDWQYWIDWFSYSEFPKLIPYSTFL